jgi:hypothetical protein
MNNSTYALLPCPYPFVTYNYTVSGRSPTYEADSVILGIWEDPSRNPGKYLFSPYSLTKWNSCVHARREHSPEKGFERIGVDSPISETRHVKDIRQIIGSVSFHVLLGFSDPWRRLCKQVCIQLAPACLDWRMYQKVVCSGLLKTKYVIGR